MSSNWRSSKTRATAHRLSLNLTVESKTLGSKVPYSLNTVNISKTGLLLGKEEGAKVPFIVNTLLELTIDPTCSFLAEPVSCLAKVVRLETIDEMGKIVNGKFGVQIIQLENDDAVTWESCLSNLEKSSYFAPQVA